MNEGGQGAYKHTEYGMGFNVTTGKNLKLATRIAHKDPFVKLAKCPTIEESKNSEQDRD